MTVETIARMARRLHKAMADDLRRAMIFEYLISKCLVLYVDMFRDLERHWELDAETIERLGIRSAPSFTVNLIGSNAVAERFGDLSDVEGFYKCRDLWWLDVDEKLSRRGVILPVRDPKRPVFIRGLQVYRHVRDQRPFMLRVRRERIAA